MQTTFNRLELLCAFFALLATTAFSSAASISKRTIPPPKCCYPMRFRTSLIKTDSFTSERIVKMETTMDYEHGLQDTRVYLLDPITQQVTALVRTFMDASKRAVYTIAGDHCHRSSFKNPDMITKTRCIPDNAVYLGSGTTGEATNFDMWRITYPGNEVSTVALTKSHDGSCLPLWEGLKGKYPPSPISVSMTNIYTDFSTNFNASLAFSLPKSCS